MIQLLRANKQLREAVKACDVGMIKGYPDLELNSIDKFVTDLKEVAEAMLVNVGRVVETMERLAEVEKEVGSDPEQEVYFEEQQAHPTR